MRILALIHSEGAPAGVFGEVAREHGHRVVEWNVTRGLPPGAEEYDAYIVLGGPMHVDQEDRHPWLRSEDELLRGVLDRGAPALGICLGSQLIAKASGTRVGPAAQPEIGWFEVRLTAEGVSDPVLGGLPERFQSLQWHTYAWELPAGGVLLARSDACLQAYRFGEAAWGVQFHPEVTRAIVEGWIAAKGDPRLDLGPLQGWTALGRRLAGRFLGAAAAALEASRRVSSSP